MKPPVILVIRSDDPFSFLLRDGGCEVLNLELIKTAPADDLSGLHEKLARIEDYDGLFFTSPAAAEVFAERAIGTGPMFTGKIYVLGERARTVLERYDFDIIHAENANTAEDMIGSFDASEFEGKRLLFVRGDKSLRTIPELLKGKANVDEVVVYQTIELQPDEDKTWDLRERFERGEIDWICFFSPSGVESFRKLFASEVTGNVKAAAIGDTTARKAQELRLNVDFISQRATAEDFASGLIGHIKNIE